MNHKVKAFCLAVAAVSVMAFFASAATAASFHSEASSTTLSGSQLGEDVLTVNAGSVTCSEVSYSGTQASTTSESVTATPAYSGCKAFGFINSLIDVNGCGFTFNSGVQISCPGSPFTITAFNCWIT